MVSVLVCSINPDYLKQLNENIEQTIGVHYELLSYNNNAGNKGICEIYNLLASKAEYDCLCFVHEDVMFTTQNWGEILLKNLAEDSSIGVLGVAGSKYKSAVFSGWYTGIKELDCANIIHRNNAEEEKIYLNPSQNNVQEEVVCLDGVFICCKKEIWKQIKFDEQQLTGFHLYDIDFSLRAAKVCSVIVNYQINLVHITTGGDFTNKWMETAISYHLQHQKELPFTKTANISKSTERHIALNTLDVLKNYRIAWENKIRWIKIQKLYKHPGFFYSIFKFLLYQPLKLKYVHNLFK